MKRTVSDRQLAANRANAQKSTGPQTPEGKDRSSRNALKHGITARIIVLSAEERADYDRLHDAYFARLQPLDAMEADLVEEIVHVRWHLGRIRSIEDTTLELTSQNPSLTIGFKYARSVALVALAHKHLAENSPQLALANRQLSRLNREYHRLLKTYLELRRLCPLDDAPQEPTEPIPIRGNPTGAETTQVQNEPIPIDKAVASKEIRLNHNNQTFCYDADSDAAELRTDKWVLTTSP